MDDAASWTAWQDRLAGEPDEDLSTVFTKVRIARLPSTQASWANDWRTRAFCDLGLHLIHEHQVNAGAEGSFSEVRIFRNLGPEELMNHAARMFADPRQAAQLDRQRWTDTWGHQSAFTHDLMAYLFRVGPSMRRIREVHDSLVVLVEDLPFEELVRSGAALELQSSLADPIIGLQTFMQAALSNHALVRSHVRKLEEQMLDSWAAVYQALAGAYGLKLRDNLTWRDVAELFTTVIEGTLLRARTLGETPKLTTGDDMLAGSLIAMIPYLLPSR